jgi:hypothetical protein
MPQVVIARLRTLMEQPDLPALPAGVVFGEGACPPLSDNVCDLIDLVQLAARNVFGGSQPSRSQERQMEEAGFPLLHHVGTIRTRKGLVRYKP